MLYLYYIGGTTHDIPRVQPNMKMPMFSDNSRVYQKPGSYSVGVGSVKNRRVKSLRS